MSTTDFEDIFPEPHHAETLAEGFAIAEGPVWFTETRRFVFSEVGLRRTAPGAAEPNAGRRHSFDPATGRLAVLSEATNNANGLARDKSGRLVACEMGPCRVTRLEVDGTTTVLASEYDGQALRAPNDVVTARDGGVYFTDTGGGGPSNVYRISPDSRSVTLVAGGFRAANGLTFAPDERRLYVNDSRGHHSDDDFWMSRGSIWVYDVQPHGALSDGRVFALLDGEGSGTADGMKTDVVGNLYCSGPRGIWVFTPGGERLGVIETGVIHNQTNVTNLAFGGEDGRTLLVTTSSSLLQLRTGLPGALWAQGERPDSDVRRT